MTEEAINNRRFFNHLKNSLDLGWLTYDETKDRAEPVLREMNKKGASIAKKYGRKYHNITFTEIMR